MPDNILGITTVPNAVETLIKLANGRTHITTAECAKSTNSRPQTLRKNYCLNGHCFGIRPVKIGNRLNWPVDEIANLMSGGDTK